MLSVSIVLFSCLVDWNVISTLESGGRGKLSLLVTTR